MSIEERVLLNDVISKKFGLQRKSPLTDSELSEIEIKRRKSVEMRQRLRQLSEVPLEVLDDESKNWLRGTLGL